MEPGEPFPEDARELFQWQTLLRELEKRRENPRERQTQTTMQPITADNQTFGWYGYRMNIGKCAYDDICILSCHAIRDFNVACSFWHGQMPKGANCPFTLICTPFR